MNDERFAHWVGIAVLTSAMVAFVGILILRLGLRLSWSALAVPLIFLVALQTAVSSAMFWVRKYKALRIGILIFGAYLIALFSILVHYGQQWGLHTGFKDSDLWILNAPILAKCIGLALLPRRWSERFFAEGVMCVKCRHYHEGRDCTVCGCRADQFKWPSIGTGFP